MTRQLIPFGLLLSLPLLAACGVAGSPATSGDDEPTTRPADPTVTVAVFDKEGNLVRDARSKRVVRTSAEWKADLTDDEYYILRESGTERAFTGDLLENKASGVYTCAGCGLPLFMSDTKFKSGTGWPSFYASIAAGNVDEKADRSYGMVRTEIHCGRCDGHLGHVFDDGPRPTGLRYCVNSLSLDFTPEEKLAMLADPAATKPDLRKAVFAGGCFWCVEAVFEELDGVEDAISGYAGGTKETANYKAVSSGVTKHAEAVQIVYDANKLDFADLLRVHFATHNPTTLNQQGADRGPHYRSAIFYANDEEKALATAFMADLNDQDVYDDPIVTTLEPLTEFYPAEKYHQNYVCENPNQGYVRAVAMPKVDKVRKQFKDMLKDKE